VGCPRIIKNHNSRVKSVMLGFDQGSQKEVYKSKVAFKAVGQGLACQDLSKLGVIFKAVRNEVGTKGVMRERV
jgi:hypothetical protein